MRPGLHNDTYRIHFQSTFCQVGQFRPTIRDLSRFWAKVHKTDGCWLWTASVSGGSRNRRDQKYGQFTIGSRPARLTIGAHIFAYLTSYGPIPEGLQIRHTCDRSLCVRPDHLTIGTFKQNMEDAAVRGRLHVPRPSRHKLTPEQIEDVRRQVATGPRGTANQLARALGVTTGHISQIVSGKRRQYDAPLLAAQERAS